MAEVNVLNEKVLNTVKEYTENGEWIRENFDELREKYGGNVVAVLNKKVLCASSDPSKIRERLKKLNTEDLYQTYVYYIPKQNEILLW